MTFYNPMRPYRSRRYDQTRAQLRRLAREHGVRRGRNTDDTVQNLVRAGVYKAKMV